MIANADAAAIAATISSVLKDKRASQRPERPRKRQERRRRCCSWHCPQNEAPDNLLAAAAGGPSDREDAVDAEGPTVATCQPSQPLSRRPLPSLLALLTSHIGPSSSDGAASSPVRFRHDPETVGTKQALPQGAQFQSGSGRQG